SPGPGRRSCDQVAVASRRRARGRREVAVLDGEVHVRVEPGSLLVDRDVRVVLVRGEVGDSELSRDHGQTTAAAALLLPVMEWIWKTRTWMPRCAAPKSVTC